MGSSPSGSSVFGATGSGSAYGDDVRSLLSQMVRLLQDGTVVEIDGKPVAAAVGASTFYGVSS